MFSPRLGCGLIAQRASLGLSALSSEQRGFPVRKTPKNLLLERKLKASAGLATVLGARLPHGRRESLLLGRGHRSPAPTYGSPEMARLLCPPLRAASGPNPPRLSARAGTSRCAWRRGYLRVAYGDPPRRAHCPRNGGSLPPPRGIPHLQAGRSLRARPHLSHGALNFSSLEMGVPHPPPRAPPSHRLSRPPRTCGWEAAAVPHAPGALSPGSA